MGQWQHQAKVLARRVGVRRAIDIVKGAEPYRSEWLSLGLRRDLTIPFTAPDAKIPLTIRRLAERDLPVLFDTSAPGLSADELALRKNRRELAESGIGTGFVAVTTEDEPCYVQWLFGPEQNRQIHEFFHDVFPPLQPGEALLEGAFTPEQHRGKGIMPCAMARIAEQATSIGARWVITFVTESNIPSLKGCDRAGFEPYLRRSVRWNGLRRILTFTAL